MEGRPHKGALFQKMNTDFTSKMKHKRSEVRRDTAISSFSRFFLEGKGGPLRDLNKI